MEVGYNFYYVYNYSIENDIGNWVLSIYCIFIIFEVF